MAPQRDDSPAADVREANRLVAQLQNLHLGPLALPSIVSLGETAVPALEGCLRGPSQALYHPRALAAEALGTIGGELALAALIRALRDSTARVLDPTFREAEAVVVDRIASHLASAPSPAAIEALLDALRARPARACAEALGDLGDARAIPALVDSLREDSARDASMQALRRFGSVATPRLRAALAMPHYVHGLERPIHVEARAAAATLLGELNERSSLERALSDRQRSVRLAAAVALARAPNGLPAQAVEILLAGLDDPDWSYAQTIMRLLRPLGPRIALSLLRLLEDKVSDAATLRRHRRGAVLAGGLGLGAAAPTLAALSAADDPELRFAAIHALAQIPGAKDDEIASFLCDSQLRIAFEAFDTLARRRQLRLHDLARALKQCARWRSWWKRWRRIGQLHAALRWPSSKRRGTC